MKNFMWNTIFKGSIFAVQQQVRPNGDIWERVSRSPGVRLLINNNDGSYILTREFRQELNGRDDVRLPGGKVFDKLNEYIACLESDENIEGWAKKAAIREAKEEVGIEDPSVKLIYKSVLGTTVNWDLYVFELTNFKIVDQMLGEEERIDRLNMTAEEILQAIRNGLMSEDRIVSFLSRYLTDSEGSNEYESS